MAITPDPDAKQALQKIVGRRLKAARRAAGKTQVDAMHALKHKGLTQISLAEEGERLPPLLDLVKYAELYVVPLDFLLGRIDDPIAESDEQSAAMVVNAVSAGIGNLFEKMANAVGEHVQVCVLNQRQDRTDLKEMIALAIEAEQALDKVRKLNPEYEELLGGASLEKTIGAIVSMGKRMESRTALERRQYEMIDKALALEEIKPRVAEFQLQFDMFNDVEYEG